MKHKLILALLVAIITLSSSNCKKFIFDETLPPITQEGKNTFGCMVDGKLYVPGETLFGNIRPLSCNYYTDSTDMFKTGSLFIQGIAVNKEVSGNIFIQKMNLFRPGKYQIINDSCANPHQCDILGYYKNNEGTDYVGQGSTYLAITGELNILRLDTIKKIVSGTFSFTARNQAGRIREITNGRFDLKIEN